MMAALVPSIFSVTIMSRFMRPIFGHARNSGLRRSVSGYAGNIRSLHEYEFGLHSKAACEMLGVLPIHSGTGVRLTTAKLGVVVEDPVPARVLGLLRCLALLDVRLLLSLLLSLLSAHSQQSSKKRKPGQGPGSL